MKANYILIIIIGLFTISCSPQKEQVDSIYFNGVIYTVDSTFSIQEAFATKNGKFIAVGSSEYIKAKYDPNSIIDLEGRPVYPGFYDAHCHFLGYGLSLNQVDLVGTKSFDEVIERIVKFSEENPNLKWITGRGWDQNDWVEKKYPNFNTLNELFPNKPIAVRRIDGHGLLANQKAIELSGISVDEIVDGIERNKAGGFTGIFIDNAAALILKKVPEPNTEDKISALLKAQENCFKVGLTTVDDAGLPLSSVLLIDSLQKSGDLKMNIYAMLEPNDNCFEFAKNGFYKTDKLNVRSFKVYADGALGSRGACLKNHYNDKKNHAGFLLSTIDSLTRTAERIINLGYQMNTHCIGDSANKTLLTIYSNQLKGKNDKRWRIEHAQVIDSSDFALFKDYNIIPSVQPTHCTSDMYWAENRIGSERMKYAYAYKTLLTQNGIVAAGSDFPIESINPLFGFHAATSRQDHKEYPKGGFQSNEGLTREEALKSMTIWAAYSNFEEKEKGSIEQNKISNFTILEKDIMKNDLKDIPEIEVFRTYIGDKEVYSK